MTTEEKLEKAIDFIKSIDKTSFPTITVNDIINDSHVYCEECGDECEIDVGGIYRSKYVDAKFFDELKEKAWHLLVDLTD